MPCRAVVSVSVEAFVYLHSCVKNRGRVEVRQFGVRGITYWVNVRARTSARQEFVVLDRHLFVDVGSVGRSLIWRHQTRSPANAP